LSLLTQQFIFCGPGSNRQIIISAAVGSEKVLQKEFYLPFTGATQAKAESSQKMSSCVEKTDCRTANACLFWTVPSFIASLCFFGWSAYCTLSQHTNDNGEVTTINIIGIIGGIMIGLVFMITGCMSWARYVMWRDRALLLLRPQNNYQAIQIVPVFAEAG
jgi:hypothetical protein